MLCPGELGVAVGSRGKLNERDSAVEIQFNPMLEPFRFRRFSTVQLLIALTVLLISAPFVEELEGGTLILSFYH